MAMVVQAKFSWKMLQKLKVEARPAVESDKTNFWQQTENWYESTKQSTRQLWNSNKILLMCAQTNVQDLCSGNEIKLILFSSYDIEIQMCIVGTENANNQFCPEFQAQGHALQFGTFVEIS